VDSGAALSYGALALVLGKALVFCFTLARLASAIGLAPIVGAYAAGLILEDLHYRDFAALESRAGNGKRELTTAN
jgi:Kef-type K+ transport system membrane component KefB